ncbi:hypothetical protein [Sporolituus thermophilus]|uniref:Uncharacterized protein n=1 Tax=Sporolituus thermophilus DSM 23256 TaxID=1123285 RepID=A0A1G7MH76_9FIRM|nr:hypothetical protein [Sporolituus thermophilus]SDF60479.1 hypothetical protein SAMN05660235_02123 [Sporolituus thermophilus DSM 23256]
MDHYFGIPNWPLPKSTKKCVKTYTSTLKLYEVSFFRLYKVCLWCGCEFDYYNFHGVCPFCGDNPNGDNIDDPPQPGFVFFPELLLATSPLALFPELAFYP